ncbi:MAG: hypothetical protein IJM72_03220, partial [Deltaproteobacteria bacterium]|nr:hypothetical protein [Deltaproteobacteria bacterium]
MSDETIREDRNATVRENQNATVREEQNAAVTLREGQAAPGTGGVPWRECPTFIRRSLRSR